MKQVGVNCNGVVAVSLNRWINTIKAAIGRGVFPHEVSFILELPLRKLLLSPSTLADRLPLTPTSRVLEVGAGSGFYSVEVARRILEGQLELLDLQPQMLQKAKLKLEAEGLHNVGYTPADAGELPFKEDSFDVVYLVAVLGEVADHAGFLKETYRVLKPDGTLSISEHYPDPDFSSFPKVKLLVEKVGFELSKHHGMKWSYTANFRKAKVRY